MLAQLLQHMVVEAETGLHVRIGLAVEIDVDLDPRLLVLRSIRAVRSRSTSACAMSAHTTPSPNCGDFSLKPRMSRFTANWMSVSRSPTIAERAQSMLRSRSSGCTRPSAGLRSGERVRETAVDQDVPETDALALEDLQHQRMRAIECRLRERFGTEAVLIRHHDELVTGVAQAQHRRNHAVDEFEFFVGIDLEIGGLADQRAVAVDEQDGLHRAHAADACGCAASTASFSAGEPIVMRKASPSPGVARISRTTTPAANKRRYTASASSNLASRKFAALGYTGERRTSDAAHRDMRSRSLRIVAAWAAVSASAAGSSARKARSAQGCGTGYGSLASAQHFDQSCVSDQTAILAPANACSLDSVRNTATFGHSSINPVADGMSAYSM